MPLQRLDGRPPAARDDCFLSTTSFVYVIIACRRGPRACRLRLVHNTIIHHCLQAWAQMEEDLGFLQRAAELRSFNMQVGWAVAGGGVRGADGVGGGVPRMCGAGGGNGESCLRGEC